MAPPVLTFHSYVNFRIFVCNFWHFCTLLSFFSTYFVCWLFRLEVLPVLFCKLFPSLSWYTNYFILYVCVSPLIVIHHLHPTWYWSVAWLWNYCIFIVPSIRLARPPLGGQAGPNFRPIVHWRCTGRRCNVHWRCTALCTGGALVGGALCTGGALVGGAMCTGGALHCALAVHW